MGMDRFGWCYDSPKAPPLCCRWCEQHLVPHNGVLACPECDFLRFWPSLPKATA